MSLIKRNFLRSLRSVFLYNKYFCHVGKCKMFVKSALRHNSYLLHSEFTLVILTIFKLF